jgi:sarcosine oxidase subunit beta
MTTRFPSCDVIVVGAGVLGCSTALHLLGEGAGDVVVVERDGPGQATSAAGAGFVGEWSGSWDPRCGEEELAVERYGLEYYKALHEAGHQFGYRSNGNLYLAGSEEMWTTHCSRALAADGAQQLTAAEVAEVTGGVVAEAGLFAGVLHPTGGQVSAAGAARAMAALCRERGARLETRLPVRRLLVERGRVQGVETNRETIRADRVVLAAGAWTNALLRPLDVFLPMAPLVASRVVTEPLDVPPTMPTIMIGEIPFYVREEQAGLLWGAKFTAAPRRSFVERDPPERFDQLPLDGYEEMRTALEPAGAFVPRLAQAHSATVAFGAPTYTPDGRSFLGPVPGVEGLYAVGGCNEAGVTHAPGFGRAMAELVVSGAPRLCSLDALALDRFGDRYRTTLDVAGATSW